MHISVKKLRKLIREEISLGFSFKQINYTAFILDDASHDSLLKFVPDGWTAKAHHMTIAGPANQEIRIPQRWLDFEGCFEIKAIAKNDQVITARIDLGGIPLSIKGPKFPHVTIAINPKTGGKPVMSNDFTPADFDILPEGETIRVCGQVKEILHGT